MERSKKKYIHLSEVERVGLMLIHSEGRSISQVGRYLNRSATTILRKLKRVYEPMHITSIHPAFMLLRIIQALNTCLVLKKREDFRSLFQTHNLRISILKILLNYQHI